jgi:hypothetical protein
MTSARPPLPLLLWNIVSLNTGWFACVLGAANGYTWFGPAVVAVLVAIHVAIVSQRRRELATCAAAAVFGYLLDSIMVLAGVFEFPPQARIGEPSTVWMVALWVNFATGLNTALYWLQNRHSLAVLLGAVGGPTAYYGGTRFGGLVAPEGLDVLLVGVSIQWAIATPLVIHGAGRIGRLVGEPVRAEADGAPTT